MGARAAVTATRDATQYLILVSYPLQGAKQTRDQILLDLPSTVKVLFISGDRDSMCDLEELRKVRRGMKCDSWLVSVRGADHGMNAKPRSATEAVGRKTGEVAAQWLLGDKSRISEGEITWDADDGEVKWMGWSEESMGANTSEQKGATKMALKKKAPEESPANRKSKETAKKRASDRTGTTKAGQKKEVQKKAAAKREPGQDTKETREGVSTRSQKRRRA